MSARQYILTGILGLVSAAIVHEYTLIRRSQRRTFRFLLRLGIAAIWLCVLALLTCSYGAAAQASAAASQHDFSGGVSFGIGCTIALAALGWAIWCSYQGHIITRQVTARLKRTRV